MNNENISENITMVNEGSIVIESIATAEQANEYFNQYKKTHLVGYLDRIVEYISKDDVYRVELQFDGIDELLCTTSNGQTLLDVLLKYYDKNPLEAQEKFANNPETIAKLIDIDSYAFANHIKKETLNLPVGDSKTLFDFLLENGHYPESNISFLRDYPGLVQKLFDVDPALLQHLNDEVILNESFDGERLIDFMFKNNLITSTTIKNISSLRQDEFIKYAFKYHQEQLLAYLPEYNLLREYDGKTLLERLIEKGIVFNKVDYYDSKTLNILYENGQFKHFKNLSEYTLSKMAKNGKSFLEILLENDMDANFKYPSNHSTLLLYLKYGRYDRTYTFDVEKWLQQINGEDFSALDVLIAKYKEGLNYDLSKINPSASTNIGSIAKFYLKMAEAGLIKHVRELDASTLLREKDGVKVIDILLQENKDLTMNVILTNDTKEDFYVATYLRSKGIDQKEIKIPLHSMDIVEEYYNRIVKKYEQEQVTEEQEGLLNKFREQMLTNEAINVSYLDAMIASYRHLMHVGNPYGERELRKIIEIKEVDPEFTITDGSGFYREFTNSIFVENTCINTLNHEMGHLLFHNLTDKEVPVEFYRMSNELRNNPEFIKKVEAYTHRFLKITENVVDIVNTEYIPLYEKSLTEEKKKEIQEFLTKSKEEKKKALKEKGYADDTIDTLLDKTYSLEEYLEQDKRIKRNELVDAILRTKYGSFIALGDIFDSILTGDYRSEELRNDAGNIIPHAFGHGIAYYHSNDGNVFDETIANYSSIIKADDGYEVMSYLRDVVGESFVNLIDNYYNREISLSPREVEKVSRKL